MDRPTLEAPNRPSGEPIFQLGRTYGRPDPPLERRTWRLVNFLIGQRPNHAVAAAGRLGLRFAESRPRPNVVVGRRGRLDP